MTNIIKPCKNGFTMVELLVSMTIFAIVITGMMMTFAAVSANNRNSVRRSCAMIQLENLMEETETFIRRRYAPGDNQFERTWLLGQGVVVLTDTVDGYIFRETMVDTLVQGGFSGSRRIGLTGTVRWPQGVDTMTLQARTEVSFHD